jgi:hypothetical protein
MKGIVEMMHSQVCLSFPAVLFLNLRESESGEEPGGEKGSLPDSDF